MKAWIQRCDIHHTSCQKARGSLVGKEMPKRLLSVAIDGIYPDIQLVDTSTSCDYVALSYCWGVGGENSQVMTTQASLVGHQSRIPVQSLPQTIQDAVETVRRLGLQYLWVDALCIVQDDDTDKMAEIARMGVIYTT